MIHLFGVYFMRNDASGMGRVATARNLVRFAVCSACHEEIVVQFNLCWDVQSVGLRRPRGVRSGRLSTWVQAAMKGLPEQVRKDRVADEFDACVFVISAGGHGWMTATPDDVFDSLCFLDTQGKALTWCMKYLAPAWDMRAKTRAKRDPCAPALRARFYRQSVCLQVQTGKERTREREAWDLIRRIVNPCSSPPVDSYLTIVSEAQKEIGVNRAAPLLENTSISLRRDMRSRAQVAASLAAVSVTRDYSPRATVGTPKTSNFP